MDYYSQGRSQVSAPQVNQHYMNFTQATPASYSMNYGQQMQHQHSSPYQQQHYTMSAGPANSGMDYNSQHAQTMNSHNPQSSGRARSIRSGIMASGDHNHQQQHHQRNHYPAQDFPVRIVVDHKHVGAIIGNKGANIKEIIMDTKARIIVDVHKVVKDAHGNADKIITIVGSLENAGKAVAKILEIVQKELDKDETRDHHEVELRIRAHNQLVGRLIGCKGSTIKRIMQETGTHISVSNYSSNEVQPRVNDSSYSAMLPNFPEVLVQLERTITVRGPNIESVTAAEQKVSAKLRQSFEMDLQNRLQISAAQNVGGLPFITPITDQWGVPMIRAQTNSISQIPKIIKLYVPNNMVGAIIGAKGMNIRNIIRNSGALIRIEGGDRKDKSDEENKAEESTSSQVAVECHSAPSQSDIEDGQGDGSLHHRHSDDKREDDRLVTVTGTDIQQFRAQYLIYQRIAEQQGTYLDEVRLRTEVVVPSRLVGRIIGKGGQNVRELQRITGAIVKIPEDEPKVDTIDETSKDGTPIEGTIVRIIGTIQGSSSVQARIGQLIHEFSRTTIHDRKRDNENNDSGVSDSLSNNKTASPLSSAAE